MQFINLLGSVLILRMVGTNANRQQTVERTINPATDQVVPSVRENVQFVYNQAPEIVCYVGRRVRDLPQPQPETYLIVSREVAFAAKRPDVVCPMHYFVNNGIIIAEGLETFVNPSESL